MLIAGIPLPQHFPGYVAEMGLSAATGATMMSPCLKPEVPDVEVLADALDMRGLGHHDHAAVAHDVHCRPLRHGPKRTRHPVPVVPDAPSPLSLFPIVRG